MKSEYDILLSPPFMGKEERKLVVECLDKNWISTAGPYSGQFVSEILEVVDKKYGLATNTGTSAIELGLIGLGVEKGDMVAVPAWTFSATPNAVLNVGAVPVFVDIDKKLGICPVHLEEAIIKQKRISSPIKAIIGVQPPNGIFNNSAIDKIAKSYDIPVLEDAAGSLFASFEGRSLGGLTDVGCFSFNGNKIITGGGGGMVVTDDKAIFEKCRLYSANSQTPAYVANVPGSNRLMINVCAAIGLAQLSKKEIIIETKAQIFTNYDEVLSALDQAELAPKYHKSFKSNNWIYYFFLHGVGSGTDLVDYFARYKIQVRTFWRALPDEPAYQGFNSYGKSGAREAANRIICLPSGAQLKDSEQNFVTDVLKKYFASDV